MNKHNVADDIIFASNILTICESLMSIDCVSISKQKKQKE